LSLSIDEIVELSGKMEKETKALKDEIYRLCWFMRGSLSFSESYELSLEDRSIIAKIIEENLETTKKANLPFF
jgi:hypothetical protein